MLMIMRIIYENCSLTVSRASKYPALLQSVPFPPCDPSRPQLGKASRSSRKNTDKRERLLPVKQGILIFLLKSVVSKQ